MKKLISIFLVVCMLTSFGISTVFADDFSEGRIIRVDDNISIPPIEINDEDIIIYDEEELKAIQEMIDNAEEINSTEDIEARQKISTIYGEYINVFVLALNPNGDLDLYPSYKYYIVGNKGDTFVRGKISLQNQNTLVSLAINDGYLPIGWYIEGSIYLDVDNPQTFSWTETTSEGTRTYGVAAHNGSNVFNVITLYPDDMTKEYTYGLKGTANYFNNYVNEPPVYVNMSTNILVTFLNK